MSGTGRCRTLQKLVGLVSGQMAGVEVDSDGSAGWRWAESGTKQSYLLGPLWWLRAVELASRRVSRQSRYPCIGGQKVPW